MGVKKIDYIEIFNVNKIIKPFKKKLNIKYFLHTILGLPD